MGKRLGPGAKRAKTAPSEEPKTEDTTSTPSETTEETTPETPSEDTDGGGAQTAKPSRFKKGGDA